MSTTKRGFLLIADITGYTRYLSSAELEHAQGILQTLMELLIDHTKPPLVVSQLEGDAVFSYGVESRTLGGQTLVEMIEDTYVAFRRAINLMVMNTTCQCNACANIATLDLKFFVHHGSFSVQHIGGHDELVGPDVITVHRLTKNRVREATGITAYTLYTEQAVSALGLEGFTEPLVKHVEDYEHLGQLETWIEDMHPVWEHNGERLRIEIPPEETVARVSGSLPVPPAVGWELLSQPEYRALLMRSDAQKTINRLDGRVAPGSVFQCFHGKGVTTQTVLDWHPFEQMTVESSTPLPKTTFLMQLALAPSEEGTEVELIASKARGPWLLRKLCDLVTPRLVASDMPKGIAALRDVLTRHTQDGTLVWPEVADVPASQVEQAVATSLDHT